MRTSIAVVITAAVCSAAWIGLFMAQTRVSAGAPRECSVSTLQGGYGFTLNNPNPGGIPIAALGRMTFDGKGKFKTTFTAAQDGQYVSETISGTYTVAADCSGTAVSAANSGKTKFWLVTDTEGRDVRLLGGPAVSYGLLIGTRQHSN